MNLINLDLKVRVALKEKLLKFMSQIRTKKEIRDPFFKKFKLQLIRTYNDVPILGNNFLKRLFIYQKLGSLFTNEEEFEMDDLDFYKQFFLDLVSKEDEILVSMQDFIKYISVLKQVLYLQLK